MRPRPKFREIVRERVMVKISRVSRARNHNRAGREVGQVQILTARVVNGSLYGENNPRQKEVQKLEPQPDLEKNGSSDETILRGKLGAGRSVRLRILCVHGVGGLETDPDFIPSWTSAIRESLAALDSQIDPEIDFVMFDTLFSKYPEVSKEMAATFGRLLTNFVVNGIGDELRGTRGYGDLSTLFRRTVLMVAQWATYKELRQELREKVSEALEKSGKQYDAVLAHSLGSLICYDLLAYGSRAFDKKTFVTFGSQIGHPAIRNVFAGRIKMPEDIGRWFHLYNPEDHVLTSPIRILDKTHRFQQVDEVFDVPGSPLNHDAVNYLRHPNTADTVWLSLVNNQRFDTSARRSRSFGANLRRPRKRALLIGINDYPNPENRLAGCVNDVFKVSSIIQEMGFDPDEIRVVLNERATASGILDRLHWLLDGVRGGDQRFLYYSGHGAQIPAYDAAGEPDHIDECLVPYDFDWSPSRAIIDKQFCEFYSQLDYESWFVAMFDCCHAGGMTRSGGPLVRGLSPPDDVRHRALEWSKREQMWVPRKLTPLNESLRKRPDGASYVGEDGWTRRLGRAMSLRRLDNKVFDKTRDELRHHGPFHPIIMEACREGELSYEYTDGGTSYGAYTFCLSQVLRTQWDKKKNMTFQHLHQRVSEKLERLAYPQHPDINGPGSNQNIPWQKSIAVPKIYRTKKS